MPDTVNRERPPLVFPIVLIVVGVLFLVAKYSPGFDPWYVLRTYWPLILIFLGLAKIFDSARASRAGISNSGAWSAAATIGSIAFIVVLIVLLFHTRGFSHNRHFSSIMRHESQAVELQAATSLNASVQSPSGILTVSGGSNRTLDADFNFAESFGAPVVDYHVVSGVGQLSVTQNHDEPHFGISRNDWSLRFNESTPLNLKIDVGAGEGRLHLRDIPITQLYLNMGAGKVMVDLTGDRKKDVDADLEGGVGEATVRLPRSIGVIAHASGGIGNISAADFTKQGDEYTNAAYGKTPVTIRLKVHGGVGSIKLMME